MLTKDSSLAITIRGLVAFLFPEKTEYVIEQTNPLRMSDQMFSAEVNLACKLYRESEPIAELAGVITSIDTGALLLQLAAPPSCLNIGDRVRLEVALPTGARMRSKYLHLRARLLSITEKRDGSWKLRFKLWKASFADALGPRPVKLRRMRGAGGAN